MGRSKLDIDFVAARLSQAREDAKRINRKTPPHVYACATASGKVLIRYEPRGGPKVTIHSPFPSIAFDAELLALRQGHQPTVARSRRCASVDSSRQQGTWHWLCNAYMASRDFEAYSTRDQRVRRGILARACAAQLRSDDLTSPRFGDMPMSHFDTRAVITLRDRFARHNVVPDPMYPSDRRKDRRSPTTPEAGNSVLRCIRLVLAWAVEHHPDLVDGRNYAKDVSLIRTTGNGHATWGPDQCAQYEATHPRGSLLRLIYELARYTGQRLSDLARLGPQHVAVRGDLMTIQLPQAKGRMSSPMVAHIPMTPRLQSALDDARQAGVLGEQTYIAQPCGKPYAAESLGNLFRSGTRAAGLSNFPLHGLRKTAVVDLIRAGCSIHEIMAITGHRTPKEIERYGREYMREIAAEGARAKWGIQEVANKAVCLA